MRIVFSRKGLFLFLTVLIVIVIVLFSTLYQGTITKAQASGSINNISPNNGAAGTTVTLQGAGFGATLKGKITLGGNVVSNFYTDSSGNFTQTFTVPIWVSTGATMITAANKNTSTSIAFTVNTATTTKTNRVNPMCMATHLKGLSITDLNHQLSVMQQAGIVWNRTDFNWSNLETSPGVYNWSTYDTIVTTAQSYGIKLIALFPQYNLPTWESLGSGTFASDFGVFVQAVATHYKGQISLYEIGNEVNSTGTKGMSASSYTQLLISGYNGIKAADSTAKVISSGLAQQGSTFTDPILYLQQMYQNGAKGYFNYLGDHPYSQPRSPDVVSQTSIPDTFNIVARLRNLMYRSEDKSKQIMITEVGWPTTSNSTGVTQANQATYISRVFTKIMHEDYQYVPIVCIYDLWNDGTDATNDEDNFGVLNRDYTQKPSYTSMQNAAADFSSNFTAISP